MEKIGPPELYNQYLFRKKGKGKGGKGGKGKGAGKKEEEGGEGGKEGQGGEGGGKGGVLVPCWWLQKWRQYVDSYVYDSPGGIPFKEIICCHGGVVVDVLVGRVVGEYMGVEKGDYEVLVEKHGKEGEEVRVEMDEGFFFNIHIPLFSPHLFFPLFPFLSSSKHHQNHPQTLLTLFEKK